MTDRSRQRSMFTDQQLAWLRVTAETEGTSLGDVVRDAIDAARFFGLDALRDVMRAPRRSDVKAPSGRIATSADT